MNSELVGILCLVAVIVLIGVVNHILEARAHNRRNHFVNSSALVTLLRKAGLKK